MKYTSLIALSTLLVAFTGCEEVEMSNSEPITNPQLPVLDAGTISATATISSGTVMNLQEMLDAGTETVNVFSISTVSAELPEGATVYGAFQVSDSPSFENVIDFDNIENVDNNGILPFQDLLAAHQELFGKAPVERTMYYRVPLYADVEGAVYRLQGQDYYYVEGSFNTLGLDPGFEIEDAYYIIGTSGWDPVNDCVPFNHSNASPYDDPVFTITVTVAANTYFKVVPQSAYEERETEGFNFWQAIYGVETDGDTSLEGNLIPYNPETEVEPGGLKLEAAGMYNISINMETWTYTIEQGQEIPDAPGLPSGIYLRGDFNNWGNDGLTLSDEFLTTEDIGVYVIPYISMPAGGFKIADADWANINLGGQGDPVVVGEDYPLNGGDNINLTEDFTGAIILTNDNGAYSVLFLEYAPATQGASSGIYLRGEMNDWAAESSYEFVTGPVENVWYLSGQTIGAGVEFKVADTDWGSVNYGSNISPIEPYSEQQIVGLVYNAGNISLTENFSGTITLVKVGEYYFLYFES